MPNFTAAEWVSIVQGIGGLTVIALVLLYLGGWKVLPFLFKEVWPVIKERWKHSATQLERIMAKREADQDRWLSKLDELQVIRAEQMRVQTEALTRAIHDKDERMIAELKTIRGEIRGLGKGTRVGDER